METDPPTAEEITLLVSFLPRLTADGFSPVTRWQYGTAEDGKTLIMPFPIYDEVVHEFIEAASRECWRDYGYRPADAARSLADPDVVKNASLREIRAMLTYVVRGERFGDGHWAAMIEGGHVERLIRRVAALAAEDGSSAARDPGEPEAKAPYSDA